MSTNNKKPSFDRMVIVTFAIVVISVSGGVVMADSLEKEMAPAPIAVVDISRSSAP